MALTKVSTGLISADLSSVDLNIDANTLYIDVTNNRVGIGKTGPSSALDVAGTITADGLDVNNLKIESNVTATPTNDGANYIFRASGTHPDYAAGDLVIQARSSAARDIYFTTGTPTPVNRMVIDSSGNDKPRLFVKIVPALKGHCQYYYCLEEPTGVGFS